MKDFAPYVAKIQASGADSIITGNWGSDLQLLVKAAKDANLRADFYTYYAGVVGTPPALGDAGVERVKVVSSWNGSGVAGPLVPYLEAYKKKYGATSDPYTVAIRSSIEFLAQAMTQAKSTDPALVARAMEGMKRQGEFGPVEMRAADHQLLQPLFISTLVRTAARGGDKSVRHDIENTGLGFRTDARLEPWVSAQPTSCQMQRPAVR